MVRERRGRPPAGREDPPRSVFGALKAGSEAGQTLFDNEQAFRDLGFMPTVADKPAERDQSTQVMGQSLSLPVLISPTGVQMVHPEAEIGIARASAIQRGRMSDLPTFAPPVTPETKPF